MELAEKLLGEPLDDPRLLEAAREEAEGILYLRRVQQCRLILLEEGTLQRCASSDAARNLAIELSHAVKSGSLEKCKALKHALSVEHERNWVLGVETIATFILGDEFAEREKEFHRLADYERRAHSTRRKALRCLDYERVEMERRRAAAEASRSRGKSVDRRGM